MIFSANDQLPKTFIAAKRMAIAAVAMTPLLLVIVIFKQSAHHVLFAVCSFLLIPLMAGLGYGVCRVARMVSLRAPENPRDFFPQDWPLPFRLFNAIQRLKYHPLHIAASSMFINAFVVLWCGLLLIWVSTAVVLMSLQP